MWRIPLFLSRGKKVILSSPDRERRKPKRWSKWVFLPPFHSRTWPLLDFTCSGGMDGLTENRFLLDLPPSLPHSIARRPVRLCLRGPQPIARKPHKTGARGGPLSPRQTCSQSEWSARASLALFDMLACRLGPSLDRFAADVCLRWPGINNNKPS